MGIVAVVLGTLAIATINKVLPCYTPEIIRQYLKDLSVEAMGLTRISSSGESLNWRYALNTEGFNSALPFKNKNAFEKFIGAMDLKDELTDLLRRAYEICDGSIFRIRLKKRNRKDVKAKAKKDEARAEIAAQEKERLLKKSRKRERDAVRKRRN